jgi:hypothetical protein
VTHRLQLLGALPAWLGFLRQGDKLNQRTSTNTSMENVPQVSWSFEDVIDIV